MARLQHTILVSVASFGLASLSIGTLAAADYTVTGTFGTIYYSGPLNGGTFFGTYSIIPSANNQWVISVANIALRNSTGVVLENLNNGVFFSNVALLSGGSADVLQFHGQTTGFLSLVYPLGSQGAGPLLPWPEGSQYGPFGFPGTANTAANDSIVTSGTVSPGCQLNVTPALLQIAPAPWANETYDDAVNWASPSPPTFSAWACKLVSSVMLINYQALEQSNSFRATPDDLNAWLIINSSDFAENGWVDDGAIDAYVASRSNSTLKLNHQKKVLGPNNNSVISSYICSGNPVILEVPIQLSGGKTGSHFVLATGQTSVGGFATFSINDPLHGATTLQQQYAGQYLSIRPYSGSSASVPALLVSAHSPVELLATDPVGNQTGLNPITGLNLSQIPDSTYSRDSIVDDINPLTGDTTPEIKTLEILTPQAGTYTIQAIGSGTGAYTIDFQYYDGTGAPTTTTITGTTIPGVVNTHIITYSTLGTKPGLTVPCAADLNNDGVVNSKDLAIVEASFGATRGQTKYNPVADVNQDGLVNIIDLSGSAQESDNLPEMLAFSERFCWLA